MPDRIADHYDRHAHAFDAERGRDFIERHWFDRFLLAVPRGGHILDLGCGAGEPIDRYLIDSGHNITGVDISPRMIALARTRFGRHEWIHADMRHVGLGRAFHGVLAWDSLFHLPHQDQADMIKRVGTWLEPGGAFMFTSGAENGVAIGAQFGEALYHASLDPSEYRELFRVFGLIEIAYAPNDPSVGGRTVWLTRKLD